MLEGFCLAGIVLACVLLIERPWRNVRVSIEAERVKPVEQGDLLAFGAPVACAQTATITPQQVLQVHKHGVAMGRQQLIHQLYNPSLN